MSLIVVIPAFNAARHIRSVMDRIAAIDSPELNRVIVVDDGSTDGTRAALDSLPRLPFLLERIDRGKNGGYGAAMKDALERARLSNPDLVATIHADGQYSPEVLPRLAALMETRGLDLLQGSRIASGTALAGGMPIYKYLANAVLNRIENGAFGLSMSDYHSGYLLYGRRALERLPFRAFSDSFDFDLEVIACACARGLSVGEEPIPTHYGDEKSHLRPVAYGLRVLRVIWKYRRGQYARI